jgi:UPF0716 protein FxsA
MSKLFLLFTLVPVVELYLLFQIGHALGALAPVLMVLGSGLLGISLARAQGLRMYEAWRASLARGVLPSDSVVDGVLMLLGCLLLIVPGLITDAAGLLLLVPPLRRPFGGWLMRRVERALQRGTIHVAQQQTHAGSWRRASAAELARDADRTSAIDVEGEEVLGPRPNESE